MVRKSVVVDEADAQVLLLDAVLRDQHRGLHQEAHADAEHHHVERGA